MSRQFAEIFTKDPLGRLRPAVLSVGLGLLGAAVVLRFAVSDPAAPVLLLGLLPIAVLAIELEQRGGVAAAAATVAALSAWSTVKDVELSFLSFISRVTAFFLVALLVGYLVERLQSARETQRRLFEWSLDPLIGVNVSGDVRSVNSRALGLFGCRRDEMIDHSIEEFLPGFFSELNTRTMHADDPNLPYPLSGRKRIGNSIPLSVNVAPWESEEGALLLSLRRANGHFD